MTTATTHALWQLFGFLPEHGGARWLKVCSGSRQECEAERYRQGSIARVVKMEILPKGVGPAGEDPADYAPGYFG